MRARAPSIDTTSQFPNLPKKFAAKIRARYERVSSARDKIAYVEAKSRDVRFELDEFERNAHSYAELHYPSVPDPSAYPTTTRINSLTSWLENKTSKITLYHEELLEAENEMVKIEAELVGELSRMRPTEGRVPWPERPESLDALRKLWEKEFVKSRRSASKQRERSLEHRKKCAEREAEDHRRFLEEMADIVRQNAAIMPAGKAEAYLMAMQVLLFEKPLSVDEIYSLAEGKYSVLDDRIAEIISRIAQLPVYKSSEQAE